MWAWGKSFVWVDYSHSPTAMNRFWYQLGTQEIWMSEGKSTDISNITLDYLKAWLLHSQLGNVWGQRTSDNMWTHFWLFPLGEGYRWSLGCRPGMLGDIQQCSGQPDNTEWSDIKCQKCWSWETMTEESKKKKNLSMSSCHIPQSSIIWKVDTAIWNPERQWMAWEGRQKTRQTQRGRRGSPDRPVVKNLPSNEGDVGSIPGWGTKIPNDPCN